MRRRVVVVVVVMLVESWFGGWIIELQGELCSLTVCKFIMLGREKCF